MGEAEKSGGGAGKSSQTYTTKTKSLQSQYIKNFSNPTKPPKPFFYGS